MAEKKYLYSINAYDYWYTETVNLQIIAISEADALRQAKKLR
jgi:hypothetical protein